MRTTRRLDGRHSYKILLYRHVSGGMTQIMRGLLCRYLCTGYPRTSILMQHGNLALLLPNTKKEGMNRKTILAALLAMASATATYGQEIMCGGLVFTQIEDNTLSLVKSNDVARIVVPATVEVGGERRVVSAVAGDAFYCSFNISDIRLPEGVTQIGEEAFSQCRALKSLHLATTTPPQCSAAAFDGLNLEMISLHVPVGS